MTTRPFDQIIAHMDPAMVVVTAAVGEDRGGCLVGFHCQASIEPATYAVWLSRRNHTTRLAAQTDHIGIHLLGTDQHHLAEHFGGQTADDGIEKLADVDWEPGPGGVPLLVDCSDRFVGRIIDRPAMAGDHTCVVLEPLDARATSTLAPLRLAAATDIDPGHEA